MTTTDALALRLEEYAKRLGCIPKCDCLDCLFVIDDVPKIIATLRAVGRAREALTTAETALDTYGNEDHWQGDTFRPVRLEARCKCLCCYEAYSDKGDAARKASAIVEASLTTLETTHG